LRNSTHRTNHGEFLWRIGHVAKFVHQKR
jgi:hypothetical protein